MIADSFTEHITVPGRRTGKRPTDPARFAQARRMARFLDTSAVPDHPDAVDYMARIDQWCLGQNNKFGTCGPTSVANLALLITTLLADAPVQFTDEEIIDLYRRSGNPDFDPATGQGDNGVDMTIMLSELVKNGIGFGSRNVKALAFAGVAPTDTDRLWKAGALFGGVLWGATLTEAQDQQLRTRQKPPLWDYVRRSRVWGGHAILAASTYVDQPGTAADRTRLVTWAEPVDSTDTFITQQVEESYVVLFPWHLGSRQFVQGVDLATLASDYEEITGRPFPAVTPPPPPPPADADAALIAAFEAWRATKGR